MAYIKLRTLELMIKKQFGHKSVKIEEIQIEGKFHKLKDNKIKDSLRIHYNEN